MNFDKYKDNGITGLTNLGNTCFLNAIIQVLSHTYELNELLNTKNYQRRLNNKPDSILLIEWDELRSLLWSNNGCVAPLKFVKTVQEIARIKGIDMFSGFNQNDLTEFLCMVIDCFHNALSREVKMNITGTITTENDTIALKCYEQIKQRYNTDYSEMLKIFYGIHVSILEKVSDGKKISTVPESFFRINLAIPPISSSNGKTTLLDCFDLYIEPEKLVGDNCLKLEETNEPIEVIKRIMFWSLPDILVIDFKRFYYQFTNVKTQQLVDFPLQNLDLSKYVIGYKKETYIYDLYGICNHMGSASYGHYTSFVKNANGKWYHYNDTSVVEVVNNTSMVTANAYCLFYRKKQ